MQQKRYIGPITALYGRRATVIFPGESIHDIAPGHVVAQFESAGKPMPCEEVGGWREYPAGHFQHPDMPYPSAPQVQ